MIGYKLFHRHPLIQCRNLSIAASRFWCSVDERCSFLCILLWRYVNSQPIWSCCSRSGQHRFRNLKRIGFLTLHFICREGYELWCYFFRTYVPSMPDEMNYFLRYVFSLTCKASGMLYRYQIHQQCSRNPVFNYSLKWRASRNMWLDYGKFILQCSNVVDGP